MRLIRIILKKICPKFVLSYLRSYFVYCKLIVCYKRDFNRYLRFSSTKGLFDLKSHDAYITKLYHVLEKGLSMPNPRPGFGEKTALPLMSALNNYIKCGFSEESHTFQSALSSLKDYFEYREKDNTTISPSLLKTWTNLSTHLLEYSPAILKRNIIDFENCGEMSFEKLSETRHSIRNYSERLVDENLVKKAISISQNSPSVCNRQSTKVYSITSTEKIRGVLELQNGNRGFGHLASKILIVTSDLRAFSGPNERNQAFIDGGMFSMSLLYALHYLRLGACPLNWCNDDSRDKKLREIVAINNSEVVIMLISVGHLPEIFFIANSKRKPLEEIYSAV